MSGPTFDDALWLLSRARGVTLVNRLVIGVCPLLATLCTTLAAGRPMLIVSAAIVALGAFCVVFPDSHLGLIVTVSLAVEWIIRVNDDLSAWSIGTATFAGCFHVALAFAGVAPAGAPLSRADAHPWIRRSIVAIAPIPATWLTVATLGRADIGPQALPVTFALLVLALAGHWSTSRARLRSELE